MSGGYTVLKRGVTVITMAAAVILLTKLTTPSDTNTNEPTGAASEEHATEETSASPKPMESHSTGVEINYSPGYSALDPLAPADASNHTSLFDPQDEYWGLPRTEGYELTAAYCTACHSIRIVMQQEQPLEGWEYLLNWMTEKQGMAAPHPDDREVLLNYLVTNFGPNAQ